MLRRGIKKMFSLEAEQGLNKNKEKQRSWDLYFLNMLELVKTRSPDENTKVACILTENNRVISQAYNGHPSHIDGLPNSRPDKYLWMIHSEINCICNLLVKPTNPTAYITHLPCRTCLLALWQTNCRRIVVPKNRKVFSHSPDDDIVLDKLRDNGLIITEYDNFKVSQELTTDFE